MSIVLGSIQGGTDQNVSSEQQLPWSISIVHVAEINYALLNSNPWEVPTGESTARQRDDYSVGRRVFLEEVAVEFIEVCQHRLDGEPLDTFLVERAHPLSQSRIGQKLVEPSCEFV